MDRKAKIAFGVGVVLAIVWALSFAFVAGAQTSATVSVSKVIVGRNCDDRTVTWTQTGGTPETYTIEWLPVFNVGTAIQYDTPLRFTVPGALLTWRGRITRAGLFMVRVRAEYQENGAPQSTAWSESIAGPATANGPFLFALSVCPPGDFEPN